MKQPQSFLAAVGMMEPLTLPRTPSSWAERVAHKIAAFDASEAPETREANNALLWYYSRNRNRQERMTRAAAAIMAMRRHA